jgi:hypothetical protein
VWLHHWTCQIWKSVINKKERAVGFYLAVCQNLVPLVNPKIAGKWLFIPLKMVLIGIDPYPFQKTQNNDYGRWS